MAITARAEPDNTRKPLGHARLVVAGLPPGAAVGAAGFRLRREGHSRNNLGPKGWQVGEELLRPLDTVQEGAETVFVLGPRVTRHLEVGPVFLVLPGLGEAGLIWPDTIEVYDGELPEAATFPAEPPEPLLAPATAAPKPPPIAERAPVPPPPAPPPDPAPVPPPPTAKKPPVAALAGGGAGLLALAALAAWFLVGQEAEAPPPVPPPIAAAPPAVPAALPTPPRPAWPDSADALAPREVVAQAPDAAGIRLAALRRQQQGRHDDALVLLEEAAERGDAAAKTALGRLYDPIGFEPGRPFRSPDPRAAARHYRDAEGAGDAAATPLRAALRGWLQQRADGGNASAAAALREFW